MHTIVLDFSIAIGVYGKTLKLNGHKYHLNIFLNIFVPYACVALVLLVYPFSGLVTDVCCGRYKTVIASMSTMLCSKGCFAFAGILLMIHIDHDIPNHLQTFGEYLYVYNRSSQDFRPILFNLDLTSFMKLQVSI